MKLLKYCLLVMLLVGCVDESYVITAERVGALQSLPLESDQGLVIRVSGLIMDSGNVLQSHQIIETADQLQVLAEVGKGDKGERSSFVLDVPVPANIDKVVFGRDSKVLWERG